MAKFKPGDKKPPNSGRKKGTPNKATQTFREALDVLNFNVAKSTVDLYYDMETPPDIKFKCLSLLAQYAYFMPKNPLDAGDKASDDPGDGDEDDLSNEQITRALDKKKAKAGA